MGQVGSLLGGQFDVIYILINACKNLEFIRNKIENQPFFDVSHFDIRNTFGK